MRAASRAALLAVSLLTAPAGAQPVVPALRDALARADAEVARLEEEAASADGRRDQAKAELAQAKRQLREGGGWFVERRVRRLSAEMSALVEASVAAAAKARDAIADREQIRQRLRAALFEEASRLTAGGDEAARRGAAADASALYGQAAARLAEAAAIPQDGSPTDPWKGLEIDLPLTGAETAVELSDKARTYRELAADIEEVLAALRPERDASLAAASAWERLSRFRGVLERAGAAAADPRPRVETLEGWIRRGEALKERAVANARHVETLRAQAEEVP